MSKPYQIQADSCLILPDIHCDTNWAKFVMEKERGNYSHVIFLGDFFDSHKKHPEVASAKETAKFVKEICENVYGSAIMLCGNHDISYMECWMANQRFSHKHFRHNLCGGFTNSKSIEINKILSWENWRKFSMFCEFGGYILSHAGIHPSFWNFYKTREENLSSLWEESEDALHSVSVKPSRLFEAGEARGGKARFGSPVWNDFVEEFEDNEEIGPQLVGHSVCENTIQTKGKSFCLDCAQSTYTILHKDGKLEFDSTLTTFKIRDISPP
jgi:hypothetical protein